MKVVFLIKAVFDYAELYHKRKKLSWVIETLCNLISSPSAHLLEFRIISVIENNHSTDTDDDDVT